ncbi:hypothetical protein Leryth_013318 [Lithospermum erythrorhizon]|nr:hypothetical protein Leryth_013318 [Lithospermum erythrorhizon]
MQALSIWPARNEAWLVPQLNPDLGSCFDYRIRKNRRKRWNLACSLGHNCCNDSELHMFGKYRNIQSNHSLCYLRCEFVSRASRLEVFRFCNAKKGFVVAPFAVAWALEEHSVGHNSLEVNSKLLNGIRVDVGNEESGCTQSDIVKERDLNCINSVSNTEDCPNDQEKEDSNEESLGYIGRERVDVREFAQSLYLAKTADDVEEVLGGKSVLPLQVYSSVIRGFGKEKKFESAMALVEWLKRKSKENDFLRPNLFIYNGLLGAVKQARKFDVAVEILNDMTMEGVHPNIVTYNTLMNIYIEQGRESEALNLFEEIKGKGLSPTPASYSTILLAYRRMEDAFGALKFFVNIQGSYKVGEIGRDSEEDWDNEFVKLENFTIRICYQVIRRWLVGNKNFSTDVLRLLTEMDKVGLQTGRAEFERLVWACTRPEHHVVAKELYTRIRERYSEISLSVCNHVIWVLGKAKKWWAALEIYEDLLDKGPEPNNMSYELIVSQFNILLTAAQKRGIWRWGVRLLNKMEEKGLKPGSREWNSVLIACSKASETSAAVQIFKRMVERGEKPTIISYGALLSSLEKGKLYDEALQVWKHMIRVGVQPNLYAYTIMASIYAAQGKFNVVESIIQEMAVTKIEPTVVTFNAIISACAKNNLGTAAYEWFQRMLSKNVSPNEVSYDMLIEALANDGVWCCY